MRHSFLVMAAFTGGGIMAAVAPHSVMAAPFPQLAVGVAAPIVEAVGYWRRYCKYNDCTGDPNVDVDVTAPAVVTPNPPVVAIVPVRPFTRRVPSHSHFSGDAPKRS